jgi:hypothetical protein
MANETLFRTPRVGVVKPKSGDNPFARVAMGAVTTDGDTLVTIDYLNGDEVTITVSDEITNNKNTGIITFSDSENDYYIRPLRDEDGYWLSALKTPLPVEALMQKIKWIQRNNMALFEQGSSTAALQEETLAAFSYPGSTAIVGLIYNDSVGRWLRIEGDWILVNDIDDSLILDDAVLAQIDLEFADEFINLFDEKHLDINRIGDYTQKFDNEEAQVEQ